MKLPPVQKKETTPDALIVKLTKGTMKFPKEVISELNLEGLKMFEEAEPPEVVHISFSLNILGLFQLQMCADDEM